MHGTSTLNRHNPDVGWIVAPVAIILWLATTPNIGNCLVPLSASVGAVSASWQGTFHPGSYLVSLLGAGLCWVAV
jgi:hypothetical protein